MSATAKPIHVIAGWTTDDPEQLRLYTERAKDWGYVDQLRAHVRLPTYWLVWLLGPTLALFGKLAGSPEATRSGLALALLVLVVYPMVLRIAVRTVRGSTLVEGTVEVGGDRHRILRSHLVAELHDHPLGDKRIRVFLSERAAAACRGKDGRVRVLVAYDPASEMSPAIGFRRA
ncbi:MAG: hypothetical protein U0230_23810 [Polyangiales bacterium]